MNYEHAIANERQTIREQQDILSNLAAATLPRRETTAALRQHLEDAATDHVRKLRSVVDTAARGRSFAQLLPVVTQSIAHSDHLQVDLAGPLVALFGVDFVMKHLQPYVLETEDGPPAADVDRGRAAAESKLHAAEVREEILIRKAEAEGVFITRRAEANPDVVLAESLEGE